MNKDYKLAIVGSKDACIGFHALGVTVRYAAEASEALEAIQELKEQKQESGETLPKFAIIFVSENLYKKIDQETYRKLTKEALPAIVSIPNITGSTGFGVERLKNIVERAVGTNILG